MPGQAQSAAGRAGGLPSPASSLAPRWPVHPLSALVALGWGEQPVPAGGGAPGPGVTAGCGAHGGTMQGDTPSQTRGLQTPGHLWDPRHSKGTQNTCASACTGHTRPPGRHVDTPVLSTRRTSVGFGRCQARVRVPSQPSRPGENALGLGARHLGGGAPGRTARPPGPSGPRTAESQPPWGALRDLCYHEAGPLTVPAVQMRKQAQRADRQVRKPARPHRRPGLRLLLPSALPNGNGALGPEGPRRERALAAVLAAISGVTATALRLARRGWAASSGLTFDSSPDQGHIHGTDGKFSPDAKTRVKRLQDQNRKG